MFTRFLLMGLLCLAVPAQSATLFSTNSTWRFLRGTNEASFPDITAWRNAGFNDAAFVDAPAPFWYGDVRPAGTELTDMINNYSCIFLRKTVSVANASEIAVLRLNYFIDDGFILWINGTEVYRENVTGAPTIATLAANQPNDPAPMVSLTVFPPAGILKEGNNIFAIQVFNTTLGSSDLGFDCSIESPVNETVPPTIISFSPPSGSRTELTQISVVFSEPVTGVSSDDLVIAGVGATGVTGSGAGYTFTFAQPFYGEVPISWESSHGITDLAAVPNPFDANAPGATWSYTLVDTVPPTITNRFPEPGVTVSALRQIEVTFSENVTGVDAADLRVNGQPATNVIAQPNAVYLFQFPQPAGGAVQILFAPGHGITDLAVAPNAFAGSSWSYTLNTNAAEGDLVITEINANNQNGLLDEDGEAQDWIEIFNRGSGAADLNGWSLSDDEELPGQWIFPARVLLPNQYLVVFASGKDRKAPSGSNRFHTNFKLANDGEFLGLFNSDSPRALVSGFAPKFPVQRNDYSYGSDAGGNLRYFATPTPGSANGTSTITGVVEPVHFSSTRGHYTQPFDLVLTCPTPGAVIRYTTDGSEPTEVNGKPYIDPLRLTNTTLLRVSASRSGFLVSKVSTHSYFFGLTPANRSLPTLSIVTHSNNLTGRTGIIGMSGGTGPPNNPWTATGTNDYYNPTNGGIAWERPVSVEYMNPADNSSFQVDAGIRVHGSDWTKPRYLPTSKFSYRLYFRGDYGSGRLEFPLMPTSVVDSFDQIVLRAGHNDEVNPFITDELARQLFADQGQVSVHGTIVNFWLNGVLKLYYNPAERVEEGFLQSWHGGGKEWDIITVGSVVQGGDNVFWNALRAYVSGQNVLLPSVYQEIERRMDLTNFIDYLILNTYAATWDWPHNNWRAARERAAGGRFRFYVWDAEGAFGFTRSTPTFDSFSTSDSGLLPPSGTAEIPRFYQGLRLSPEFRLLWADRVNKHFFNNGAMTDTNITKRFLELRAKVIQVIPSFNNAYLTSWIPQRRTPLLSQYVTYGLMASSNAPVFSQHGGPVPPGFNLSISNGTGTIYYTLDGSDPRVRFTGAVSGNAIAYVSPITLNQSVLIRARTRDDTNWSAVTEATFEVGTRGSPLRITEINYNPVGGSVHEFIELQNISGAPLDLSGTYFDEGITFTFPAGSSIGAGARLVLANGTDANSFAIRYPGVPVAGYFGGNLNNSGERLTLRTPAGQIILTVDYKDSGGWPTAADGAGATLELVSPYGDPDDPANWQASAASGGTPGAANSTPPVPAILLNEIMAENGSAVEHNGTFPDWVELYNPSGTTANLAGWSLTDDGNARKFVFPGGTQIPAGGYLVVWCDDATNTTPGIHTGFSLQREGDNVSLFDAATNRVDAFSFGLQLTNHSMGRVSGEWVLNTPTPGTGNSAAPVAAASSLSINEWQASAPSGQSDWIELYNTSAQPVALRGAYLATTSAVHRITSHSFAPPYGFVQFFADEGVGPDHLDFKLPASGGAIILYDATAAEIGRVNYTNAVEGLTRGRLPDGTANIVNFPGSASPGASNYVNTYTGAVINEVLARNRSAVTNAGNAADYVELFNTNGTAFSLAGMSLSVNSAEPGQYMFPATASVPANGFLVIWCDELRPASIAPGDYNTGISLDGESGGVYLFNALGQVINSVDYGFQVSDRPIGLSGGQWRLLASATPGAVNSAAAALGTNAVLRFNEWMANPVSGSDWFELFNPANLPIELSGLFLTDDPSLPGQTNFRTAPLSFIGPHGFVKWVADGDSGQGRDHVSFSLDAQGETLRLYSTNGTNFVLIDSVTFDAQQLDVSEGRLPDGQANIVNFIKSATPGESNFLPLPSVVINEVLTHTDPPLEDAVELFNPGAGAVGIGGWYLSDSQDDFKKYRLPDGTSIAAGGFVVIYQSQFSNGSPSSFTFDSAHGDEVWLSAADAAGNLTGYRAGAKFGAAANGVSFGRVVTSLGVDYAAMSQRTLAQANAAPLVGPVVINELMYHPQDGINFTSDDEYIELRNVTGAAVMLHDPAHPANTWRLTDGVEFAFPQGAALAANGYLLVVPFDPANTTVLNSFRAKYGVPGLVPVYGPYTGKLDNGGEEVELLRPDSPQPPGAPDAGFIPYVLVDKVDYRDSAPWPSGAVDGGGLSLQRLGNDLYGNEPLNWVASLPTPGAANGPAIVPPPIITASPQSQNVLEGAAPNLFVAATGAGPLGYQWRFNGTPVPGATNTALLLDYAVLENIGDYDCIVSNPGGAARSASARLGVVAPPSILLGPVSQVVNGGATVTFSVVAHASPPITYQWRLNGLSLPGETASSLLRTNVTLADDGLYDVLIANPSGMIVSASARLTVQTAPLILNPVPRLNLTAVPGETLTLGVQVRGTKPIWIQWRKFNSAGGNQGIVKSGFVNTNQDFLVIPNLSTNSTVTNSAGIYTIQFTNLVGGSLATTSTNHVAFLTVLLDSNANGIPDNWESDYFGSPTGADRDADSDGDGMSNRAEYLAGTNPTNAASYLRIEQGPGAATVSVASVSNRTYTVQFTDGLGTGVWQRLGDIVAAPTNRVESFTDAGWTTNRFYRVATPRQP